METKRLIAERNAGRLILGLLLGIASVSCSNGTQDNPAPSALSNNPANYKINDTGIAQCLNSAAQLVACNTTDLPGQDGDQGQDYTHPSSSDGKLGFRFVKLAENGGEIAQSAQYTQQPWACVQDVTTGYTWEVKADDSLSPRYFDWVYSWYNTDPAQNLGTPGFSEAGTACYQTPCNTEAYIQSLNEAKLCGFDDWRLPNLYELRSIRDYGTSGNTPAIDTNYFPNDPGDLMWTAVNRDTNSDFAFALRFNAVSPTGLVSAGQDKYYKGEQHHIRAVRGGTPIQATTSPLCRVTATNPTPSPDGQQTPTNRYIVNDDATVQDRISGLMWKRCVEGQSGADCSDSPGTQFSSFAAVIQAAKQSAFAGYFDWRVPNIKELASIVEPLCGNPAINLEVFPATSGYAFWSSSPVMEQPGTLYYIHFADGAHYPKGQMELPNGQFRYLRLVRNYR